jgi:hypothetical protein
MATITQCDRCKTCYTKSEYSSKIQIRYKDYDLCKECTNSFILWFNSPTVKISREENTEQDEQENA